MNANKEKIKAFTDLIAWQKGHELSLEIYEISRMFPKEEIFGITNQMRRSAVSVTSNIAEGFSRNTDKDKNQFYSIALGSLTELQSQLLLARDLHYLNEDRYLEIYEIITITGKLIRGLKKFRYSIQDTRY